MLFHTCDSSKRKQTKCPRTSSLLPIVRYGKKLALVCLPWSFFTSRSYAFHIIFM